MTRISDINNRIESQMILSDVEVPVNGIALPFDVRFTSNPSKFKRLAVRKIKGNISDNPGYPFAIDIRYYDYSTGSLYLHTLSIRMTILLQEPIDIGMEIVDQLNDFIVSKGKNPRFSTSRVNDAIYFNWDNTSGSSDYFEIRLYNEYTIGHFSFQGGADSTNPNSRKITKDNWYLYIRTTGPNGNYKQLDSYDLSNLYLHWDISDSMSYVCELEEIATVRKIGTVVMKEYGLYDIKLFRLDNNDKQFGKIWFTNDGTNAIPLWFKRLSVEYVMFY